jgi:aryl-alcohol dehydrogenase-like predicted oxidoreductase
MEKRLMGATGMEAGILGFGGAEIGYRSVPQPEVDSILNSALDAGLNLIDTAACYADSEEKIGRAVSHRRSEYLLFTKCGHTAGLEGEDWDPDLIRRSIERSLQRLKTDRVDLVMLHTCGRDVLEAGAATTAVLEARDRGLTRFVGYSGDGKDAYWAVASGLFDVLETSINIADQQVLEDILPLAVERGMGVVAKRPIANAAWRAISVRDADEYARPYFRRLKDLDYPFLTGDLETGVDVALRFTLSCPGVHTAIVGTTKPGRWQENAAVVAHGPLPQADYEAIRERWRRIAPADWIGLG